MQPPSRIKEINAKYPKDYYPSVKKNKEDTYQEHYNETSKDKKKAKSYNSSFANQFQTQVPKKDKYGHWEGYLATEVNAIKVAKKDKNKAKDLNHVKYYTYKQKSRYANKCLENLKN